LSDAIEVKLAAQDAQFVASSKAAAAAVAGIAAQEARLGKAAAAAGVDQKKFSAAFAKVERARVAESAKGIKSKAAADKKQAADASKAERKKATDAKTAEQAKSKALKKANDDEKKMVATMLAEGGAVVAATIAVGALAVAIGVAALGASNLKAESLGALDILTNGRGPKALALLDAEAVKLGLDINETRNDFIKFRQAGLDNKQSAALLKLKADLIATKHPASQVQEAMDRVLSYTANGTQTKDQIEASTRAMKLLAKQAHVAGDGTVAAALAATTLEGALARIDNSKTQVLEGIGERIKPSIDKAATAVANLVDKFLKSKNGQKAIDAVVNSLIGLAEFVQNKAVPFFEQLGEAVDLALANPAVQEALDGLTPVLKVVGGLVAATAAAVIGLGVALGLAAIGVGAFINGALAVVSEIPKLYEEFVGFGGHLVDGIVDGIKGAATRALDAVAHLGTGISEAFKKALGIHSPSTVFIGHGEDMGLGAAIGWKNTAPTGDELAASMTPNMGKVIPFPTRKPPPALQYDTAPRATVAAQPASVTPLRAEGATRTDMSASSGARTINIVQNINVPKGEDPDAWARSLRRETQLMAEAILLSQGEPPATDGKAA
jgi:hypothetical protein